MQDVKDILKQDRRIQKSFDPEMGKLQPQALDLEEAVLGAMMLEKDAVDEVLEILSPESFYKSEHQKVYEVIRELYQNQQPVDILTVTQELKRKGELDFVGGPFYISKLTNRVASAANVEFHARIVSQKFIARELIRISGDIQSKAFDETNDVFDLLDNAEASLYDVVAGNIRRETESIDQLIHKSIKRIEELGQKTDGLSGVPTGFLQLDRMTSGLQPSDMLILAARPSMGKTALMLTIARNAAVLYGQGVALFSLEMSSLQLVNRLIVSETGLSAEKLKKGNLEHYEWEQLHAKITDLSKAPIYIDDTPALSVFELRAKCRKLKSQKDIQMIVIDYLQLMTVGGGDGRGNREQEISTISRSVKAIAKELDVPIIALSQLSRAVETRGGDKKPMLSDLRESGAIEQDADMVMFIWRPDYYQIDTTEDGEAMDPGYTELIIAKHRNGAVGDVKLKFINDQAKFIDYEYGEPTFDSDGTIKQDDGIGGGMRPNADFTQPSTKTMKSKMDDLPEDGNTPPPPLPPPDDDVPF